MEEKTEGIHLKNLIARTGAPVHIIKYLKYGNKLPIIKESPGPGYLTLYHPDAVNVIIEHLAKRTGKNV